MLCSGPRCWLKDPDLRSAATAWLYHSEHRGLTCYGAARQGPGGLRVEGGGWQQDGQNQPTQHRAVAVCLPWVIESMFLCLTSHFRDLGVGLRQCEGSYWGHQCNCNVCLLFTLHFHCVFFICSISFPQYCCSHAQNEIIIIYFLWCVCLIWISFRCCWSVTPGPRFDQLASAVPHREVRVQLSGQPANDDLH